MHIYAKQISYYLFVSHYKEVTIIFSSAKTLQISYIGMQTQEVAIKPTLKVVLKSDAQQIDEVMVVAYGTAKKASFTGAASTVKGDKVLKDIPVTSQCIDKSMFVIIRQNFNKLCIVTLYFSI